MLIPRIFLKRSESEKNKRVRRASQRLSIQEQMEDHLSMAIAENAGVEINSDEATIGSKNIETLSKGYAQIIKASAENRRIELQIQEAKCRRVDSRYSTMPKVAGVIVTGLVTVFWLCLEQGCPLPMRLVQMTTALTTPRGL